MSSSVNTNLGALGAIQNMATSQRLLDQTQTKISTGLKISSAKDNGAIYGTAQGQRAEVSAYDAITNGLNRASSIVDVALAAAASVSDTLVQMREKAVAASDPSGSQTSRDAYNAEFIALRDQVNAIIANASFDGINVLGGPAATSIAFQASTNGAQTVAVPILDLRLPAAPGAIASPAAAMYLGSGADVSTLVNAADARDRVTASLDFLNSQITRLGAAGKAVTSQTSFISALKDSVTGGVGALVDADMGLESSRLKALQMRQQMTTQALSIANKSPEALLSLLRG